MPAGDIFRRREGELYQRLLAANPAPAAETDSAFVAAPGAPVTVAGPPAVAVSTAAENGAPGDSFGRVLTLCADGVALTECRSGVALVSLFHARRCLLRAQLQPPDEGLKAQPLLVPLRLTLEAAERQALKTQQPLLQQMGLRLQPERQHALLHAVPLPLRQQNLPRLIPRCCAIWRRPLCATPHRWRTGSLLTGTALTRRLGRWRRRCNCWPILNDSVPSWYSRRPARCCSRWIYSPASIDCARKNN